MADAPKDAERRHGIRARLSNIKDALQNQMTGFGTSRAKITAGEYVDDPILQPPELELLFANNDLVYTIVSKIVEDALRAGFCIERRGNASDDRELAQDIENRLAELNTHDVLYRGATFGRLFGGAGVILGVKGAGPLSTPLEDENAKGIEMLTAWDRQDMTPIEWEADGTVRKYLWVRPVYGDLSWVPVEVHASRLLTFPGALTTQRRRNQNGSWDLSVMQRIYQVLRSFDSMFASLDSMFADASQAVFKLQGLIQSIAEAPAGASQDVATRMQILDLFRSSAKAIVLDAGDETGAAGEDFTVVERGSLGTLDGTMTQYYVRLSAAARYPMTVLLGTSPEGMNATGDSDLLLYFNTVDVFRNYVIEPRLLRLIRIVAQGLGDTESETWVVKWNELQRPKPLDVKTAEKMAIDSAVALVAHQIVLPEEVALSLGRLAPTLGITVENEAREKALKEALTEVASREMTGPNAPEPEPEPPAGVSPAPKATQRKTKAKTAGRQT